MQYICRKIESKSKMSNEAKRSLAYFEHASVRQYRRGSEVNLLESQAATSSGLDFLLPQTSATQMLTSYIRYSGSMMTNMVIRSAWKAAIIELARSAYLRLP